MARRMPSSRRSPSLATTAWVSCMSTLWVLEPDQGLQAHDLLAGEVDDRLVVEQQVAVLDRALQLGLELEALGGLRSHTGLEHLVAPLALPLGPVHGLVGLAQEL